MKNTKILIVENDEVTATNLQMSLQKQGYALATIAEDMISAKNKINTYTPDIVIIDISLQESNDGIVLAEYIHKKQSIPFIFLTGHVDNNIIVDASKTEPYGYLIKPFNPLNLHATIQMALYKHNQEKKKNESLNSLTADNLNLKKLIFGKKIVDKPVIPFGNGHQFNITTCETFYNGRRVRLTRKENLFIKLFVANLGLTVSFDQAIAYIWGDDGSTENSVRTLVWRLRSKLHTDIIKSASGTGYYIEDIYSLLTLAS